MSLDQKLRPDFAEGSQGGSLQQIVRHLAQNFFFRPAVDPFSSTVPVSDPVLEVAHENGVINQIDNLGLIAESLAPYLAPGSGTHGIGIVLAFLWRLFREGVRYFVEPL